VSVTTLLNAVVDNSKTTILSAANLNASQMRKQWTVVLTMCTLIVTVIVCMGVGHHLDLQNDKKDRIKQNLRRIQATETSSPVSTSKNVHKKRHYLRQVTRKTRNDELTLLEESLPHVLSDTHFAEKFFAEIQRHHRWFAVACFYSDSFPRSLRVLSLATHIIVMLFVQSITYNLTNPDDGSCASYRTQQECLKPLSVFGTGDQKCSWGDSGCEFVEPVTSFTVVLFVAVFSAVVSTPIAMLQNSIISKYLAAPIYTPFDAQSNNTSSNDAVCNNDDNNNKNRGSRKNVSVFSKPFLSFHDSKVIHDSTRKSLADLSAGIKEYRMTLTGRQQSEFDCKYLFLAFMNDYIEVGVVRYLGLGL